MKQYLDLVRKVVQAGADVSDRTGIGTRKLFGESMKFDVQPNFKEYDRPILNIQVYQRSCDLFLGVPFNIASYALLLQLIADHCNYHPGVLTWIGGDVHLYKNHSEQVSELLSRETFQLPTTRIKARYKLGQYEPYDFELMNYTCGQPIKAPVAV